MISMAEQYPQWWQWDSATKDLPRLSLLETMVTHGCTLRCKGCTNYSDYSMSGGNVSWTQMQEWLDVIFSRVRVDTFSMIGGEPFLNKDFESWVRGFKERYPYVMLMILTNGQLLSKNQWILDCMEEYGMIFLKMTDHIPGATYFEESTRMILSRFDWEFISQPGWEVYQVPEKSLLFNIAPVESFLKTYQGEYGSMKPYNNNPAEAFEICNQKTCPLLYQGKLYKCSSVGMLERVLGDHDQINDPDWQPYLNSGLDINCSDQDLQSWINNFGKPHSQLCRMCPTAKDNALIDHYQNVTSRIPITMIGTH